jgi:hypothetical protein
MMFFSCRSAVEFENRVYITGNEESDTRQLVVDGIPSEVAFSVTLADMIDKAVEVEIAADPTLVEAYNRKYHKNYKPLPYCSYSLSASTLRIDPENLRSNAAKLVIIDDSKFEEGSSYMMPVTITSVKGGIKVLEASKTVYFSILKTIETKAFDLKGNIHFQVDFAKHGDLSLTKLPGATMETRFYCTNTMTTDPWISSIMGLEENWLIRMGDARNILDNQIQTAGSGSNATAPNAIPLKEWHHVAAVFENSVVKLYVDGEFVAQTPHPGSPDFTGQEESRPGCINLMEVYGDPSFTIGRSANDNKRRWNGCFSEMRVWKKALTRAEIANNMCYVDPADPNLVAYWRFNGSTTTDENGKTVILDHTGNGYHAVPSVTITSPIDPARLADVKCPN